MDKSLLSPSGASLSTPRTCGSTQIALLPLPPTHVRALDNAGFVRVEDLDGVSPAELAEELALDHVQAARLISEVRSGGDASSLWSEARSALELLEEERASKPIVTWVKQLDDMLGGGVQLRQVARMPRPDGSSHESARRACRAARS